MTAAAEDDLAADRAGQRVQSAHPPVAGDALAGLVHREVRHAKLAGECYHWVVNVLGDIGQVRIGQHLGRLARHGAILPDTANDLAAEATRPVSAACTSPY
jgi:hypothetical protein